MRKLLGLVCASLVLLSGAPSLAVPPGSPAPASLQSIPSLGYQMRTQGWNPINSWSNNLSVGVSSQIVGGVNNAQNGFTSQFSQVPNSTVSRIRMVYASFNAFQGSVRSEIGNNSDFYLGSAVWNTAQTDYRLVRFNGARYGLLRSRQILISDPVSFSITKNTPFLTRTYVGAANLSTFFPHGSLPITTNWNPSTVEGASADDQLNFSLNLASGSQFNTYGETIVLGYTGTSPVRSLWVGGDSILAVTGDNSGIRPGMSGWGVRVADNALTANVQYPSITPNFAVGHGAMPGDTLADFISPGISQARLLLASFYSTALSDLGTNDITNSVPLATLEANKLTEACMYASNGMTFITATLLPRATSTDGFLTIANQTIPALNAERVQFNDWLRNAGAGGFVQQAAAQCGLPASQFEVYDAAAPVEVNASNVLTQDGGYWQVPTGSPAFSGSITSAASTTSFVDSSLSPTTANNYRGYAVLFTSGPCAGAVATVSTQQSSTQLTYQVLSCTPAVGNTYQLWQGIVTQDGTHPTSYGAAQIATDFVNNHLALVK